MTERGKKTGNKSRILGVEGDRNAAVREKQGFRSGDGDEVKLKRKEKKIRRNTLL